MMSPQLGKWLRSAARKLRQWIDSRSYWLLFLLVVAATGAVLGPALLDTAIALYYSVPPRIRWGLGECAFLVILGAGLWRLCTVRPGDSWPIPADGVVDATTAKSSRW